MPDDQIVNFIGGESLENVLDRRPVTKLTAFFAFNESNDINALYQEMPNRCVWNHTARAWTLRLAPIGTVGRMFFVSPNHGKY